MQSVSSDVTVSVIALFYRLHCKHMRILQGVSPAFFLEVINLFAAMLSKDSNFTHNFNFK